MSRSEFFIAVLVGLIFGLILIFGLEQAEAEAKYFPHDKSFTIAEQRWGMPPCGQPRVDYMTPREYQELFSPEDNRYYLATLGMSLREYLAGARAWADIENCRIIINRHHTPRTHRLYCHTVLHEWSHLTNYHHPEGYQRASGEIDHLHSPDRYDVMYPNSPSEGRVTFTRKNGKKRTKWLTSWVTPECR